MNYDVIVNNIYIFFIKILDGSRNLSREILNFILYCYSNSDILRALNMY